MMMVEKLNFWLTTGRMLEVHYKQQKGPLKRYLMMSVFVMIIVKQRLLLVLFITINISVMFLELKEKELLIDSFIIQHFLTELMK